MSPLKVLNTSNCNSIISKATSQRIMKYEMRLQHTSQICKHSNEKTSDSSGNDTLALEDHIVCNMKNFYSSMVTIAFGLRMYRMQFQCLKVSRALRYILAKFRSAIQLSATDDPPQAKPSPNSSGLFGPLVHRT